MLYLMNTLPGAVVGSTGWNFYRLLAQDLGGCQPQRSLAA